MAYGELGGAEGREVLQRLHGLLEGVAAISGDVVRQRDRDEAAVEAWGEGAQYVERVFVTQWQRGVQAFADPGHALHDRQLGQAFIGHFQEGGSVEIGVNRARLGGDVLEALGVEDFLEGRGGLVGCH
ncbi:hypothetical protein D3C73_672810 [compost metagenome]